MRCSLGGVVIDTERFTLERDGEPLGVEPQVFDVLAHLVLNRDRVVLKTELLDNVWGDRFVSESALTSRIKAARRVLGDDGTRQEWIKTYHGRGYRYVGHADVLDLHSAAPVPAVPERLDQHIRFCSTPEGVRLAYATIGSGPPLVRAAHWITHLDYDWHSPVWRHWLEGLARDHTLIRYDERGCGLSDHDPDDISFEAFVEDLETVVDECGLDRFPLVGLSQGGPVAIAYADRHPERVAKLVLIGTYTQGRQLRAADDNARREAELQREMIELGWGREDPSFRLFFTSTFIPDAPAELWDDFAALLRRTTSGGNAARIFDACSRIDVTAQAERLDVPTLVLHARDELRIPFDEARRTAALIKGSRLVPLPSRNHLLRPDEAAWDIMLNEVGAFLAEG